MSEYMLSKDYFVQVIRDLIVLAEDRKEYFTDLDSAIGDGDHGINLSIGFREVNKNIEGACPQLAQVRAATLP